MTNRQRLLFYPLMILLLAAVLSVAAAFTPFDPAYNRQVCAGWVANHPSQPAPSWCR